MEHAGSLVDFWRETQVSEVLPTVCLAQQTPARVTNTETFKSHLFQVMPADVLLCKITHKKEDSFLAHHVLPFSFWFTFCNNLMLKRNSSKACGQEGMETA